MTFLGNHKVTSFQSWTQHQPVHSTLETNMEVAPCARRRLLHRFLRSTHTHQLQITYQSEQIWRDCIEKWHKIWSCQSLEKKNLECWADRRCRLGTSVPHMTPRHWGDMVEVMKRNSQFSLRTWQKTKTRVCNWHCYFIISTSIIQ